MFTYAAFARNFRCRMIITMAAVFALSMLCLNTFINVRIRVASRSRPIISFDASRVQAFLHLKESDIDLRNPCMTIRDIKKSGVAYPAIESTTLDFSPTSTTETTGDHGIAAIRPEDVAFTINPRKACHDPALRILIYIHSSPSNVERRQTIRRTWGQRPIMKALNAKILFVMGETNDTKVQEQVLKETNNFYNIIQANFRDSYRNLTLKAIAAVKWISKFCKHVPYVIKLDDDVVVNVFNLTNYIGNATRESKKDVIYCNVWKAARVIRSTEHKHFVRSYEFPSGVYPPYCAGAAVFFTGDVMPKLYNATIGEPFFWLDDVFLTGILTNKTGLRLTDTSKQYKFEGTLLNSLKRNEQYQAIFTHSESIKEMYILWQFLKLRYSHDLMQSFYRLSLPLVHEKSLLNQKISTFNV